MLFFDKGAMLFGAAHVSLLRLRIILTLILIYMCAWRVFGHVHPKEQENTFMSGIILLELEGSFHLFCHVLCAFISDMSNSACPPLPLKDYFSDIF